MCNLIALSRDSLFYSPSQATLIELSAATGEKRSERKYDHPICAIAADDDYLAVAVRKEKAKVKEENLFVYRAGELLFAYVMPHDAIQLAFAQFEGRRCLLTLNSGDLDAVDLETRSARNLLGSIATGTAFALCGPYILSADRDARIRISNYPHTYDIHAFAFLHEEFVSSLLPLGSSAFASADGDGKLMKWDLDGHCALSKQVFSAGSIVRRLLSYDGRIAAVVEGSSNITLLNSDTFEIEGSIELQSPPVAVTAAGDALYGFNMNHVFRVQNSEVTILSTELFGSELKMELFSLEGQRVNSKKILKKTDRDTEDYKRWRNPEKLSAGSK